MGCFLKLLSRQHSNSQRHLGADALKFVQVTEREEGEDEGERRGPKEGRIRTRID